MFFSNWSTINPNAKVIDTWYVIKLDQLHVHNQEQDELLCPWTCLHIFLNTKQFLSILDAWIYFNIATTHILVEHLLILNVKIHWTRNGHF